MRAVAILHRPAKRAHAAGEQRVAKLDEQSAERARVVTSCAIAACAETTVHEREDRLDHVRGVLVLQHERRVGTQHGRRERSALWVVPEAQRALERRGAVDVEGAGELGARQLCNDVVDDLDTHATLLHRGGLVVVVVDSRSGFCVGQHLVGTAQKIEHVGWEAVGARHGLLVGWSPAAQDCPRDGAFLPLRF